ncbi:hypothetical protein MRY82_09420 [bacterium]|nr:hypothetical protein [bacterium]
MNKICSNTLLLTCLLSLVYCTPERIQVDLNAPIPEQLTAPNNSADKNRTVDGLDTLDTDKQDFNEIINANITLVNNCDLAEDPSNSSRNTQTEDNQKNTNQSVSELDEARQRNTGRRAGIEPGEVASMISIDYGAMYLNRNEEGIYSLSPAFDNDSFIVQDFSVPQDQLTQDKQNFRYTSENDAETEFYISVSSPEFGTQNCSVNEFCTDSEETYQSDLYLLRYHSELFKKLKSHPVNAPLYENKNYAIYALSPQFKRFCSNQRASFDTLSNPQNDNRDQLLQNIGLEAQQEKSITLATEEEKSASFKTYFSKGKDDQAIIYFISNDVWYIALAQ